MQDANGQTPLHLAASAGALECVKQLLMAAPAACIVKDKEGATPLHSAIQDDQPECLEVVIRRTKQLPLFSAHAPWHRKSPDKFIPYRSPYRKSPEKTAVKQLSVSDSTTPASRRSPERAPSIGELVDNSGNTMTHIAARLSSKECLEVLHAHNLVRLEDRCKAGQRPLDIASPTCRELLNDIESSEDRVCVVAMELDDTASGGYSDTAVVVGTVTVSGATTWPVLEDAVRNLVVAHFGAVGDGVRNRRANKSASDSADAGGGGEGEVVGLGLSFDSVRECAIGQKTWKVGEVLAGSPAESLQNSDTSQISVFLHGCEEGRLDNLSYDTLIPANTLQNYLRLIDQYRSLVFYGPSGVGKTYVAKKLAQFVQEKEQQAGNRCEITYVCLSETYTRRNLVNLLTTKDCLLPAEVPVPLCHTPVIILDDLSKIAVSEVFGDILTAIERRGPANAIAIKLDDGSEPQLYYLLADCYIIATMDKSR
ncbi:PREDICTED: cortactin-binding protein 2-like [Priapulus caudatus]|uniref:Cortactin-binding protein 2-like n=1 Tax=Priapulus caudatus TaxID=37621 RepID=A0ABM1F159_PRICU|nr:PREDICTED: cortactin-binding protein 2-like [Priapulus caudatus]